ncbi:hypothetical protein D3C80_1517070 [compost metagenome]
MPPISSRRLRVISPMLACNWPISSRRRAGSTWLKSPLAMRAASARVWRSGWVICRVISQPASTPTTKASSATLVSSERAAKASLSRCSTFRLPSSRLTALSSSPIFSMPSCSCSTRRAVRRYWSRLARYLASSIPGCSVRPRGRPSGANPASSCARLVSAASKAASPTLAKVSTGAKV